MKNLNIKQLKTLINSIPEKYDHFKTSDYTNIAEIKGIVIYLDEEVMWFDDKETGLYIPEVYDPNNQKYWKNK